MAYTAYREHPECVPSGEIGRLVSWREHLARCGLCHGH